MFRVGTPALGTGVMLCCCVRKNYSRLIWYALVVSSGSLITAIFGQRKHNSDNATLGKNV